MSDAFCVVVLTKNERAHIDACLGSATGREIHVVDSGSTDGTAEAAAAAGARVYAHPFDTFAGQRNWALDNVSSHAEWQLHLDADERLTPALVAEIERTLAAAPTEDGFLVPSRLHWRGSWLKRAGAYPAYQMRLVHRRRGRFVDVGHGQREAPGLKIGRLSEPYDHYGLELPLGRWLEKHVRYAEREAAEALAAPASLGTLAELFAADPTKRRRALKHLSFHMPARGWLRLAYMLGVRLCFLDGRAGIDYALRVSLYEGMIGAFLREQRASKRTTAG